LGEDVALHLLGEVLDHVVALRLAVDEHVEADVLLEADHPLDLALHRLLVGLPVDLPALLLRPRLPDLRGLGEGADRRRREELGDLDAGALRLPAVLEGTGAPVVLLLEAPDPRAHLGVPGPLGIAPRIPRPVVGIELIRDWAAPFGEASREG